MKFTEMTVVIQKQDDGTYMAKAAWTDGLKATGDSMASALEEIQKLCLERGIKPEVLKTEVITG